MLLLVKHKFSLYKKFKLDIWGIYKTSLALIVENKNLELNKFIGEFEVSKRIDWICRFFYKRFFLKKKSFIRNSRYYYKLDDKENLFENFRFKKSKRFKIDFRLMRLFYLTLSYRQIKKFFRLAQRQDGLFEYNYLYFLESRIISIIYRISIIPNIFEAISFVRKNNVSVDNKYVGLVNRRVNPYKLIRIRGIFKGFVFCNLLNRLKRKALLNSIPRYIYFSYQFLFFFLLKSPEERDLINPFPLDIYKITGFDYFKR